MTLLIVFIVIAILFGLLIAWGDYDKYSLFFMTTFIAALPLIMVFMVVQALGYSKHEYTKNVVYPVKIVSLNDGTGVEGRGWGYVYRSYINDTQHFSYYREVSPGVYQLDKRDAGASTVHTDATPETARVDITDATYGCTPSWWYICFGSKPNTFVHADFHVPANSIKNDFTLDAQ